MLKQIIARDAEQKVLTSILKSTKSEFLAIYGRRRIGKTYLIHEFFSNQKAIYFKVTGMKDGSMETQLSHFTKEIGRVFYNDAPLKANLNWDEAFDRLNTVISTLPSSEKVILFYDELPWMATQNSKFLQTLEYYWNQFWSHNPRIKLIVCGSSASWIIKQIINNKGGLHNRVTKEIKLEPFNLMQTKLFLKNLKVNLSHRHIVNLYMVTGGIPFYLVNVPKGLSATQVIDQMAFSKEGLLFKEFEKLFASLFHAHEFYIELVRSIAQYQQGIGREELIKKLAVGQRGKLVNDALKALEETGFIISFTPYLNKRKGVYYKVVDEYTLFYLTWIEPIKKSLLKQADNEGYWAIQQKQPAWYTWAGYAFEAICYKHIRQIARKAKLNVAAIPHTWRFVPTAKSTEKGAQIDLLFDRQDDAITLCEIKYTKKPFVIDKSYAASLNQKMSVFSKKTKTDKSLYITMISANGLKETMYSEEMVSNTVTLDDLFV